MRNSNFRNYYYYYLKNTLHYSHILDPLGYDNYCSICKILQKPKPFLVLFKRMKDFLSLCVFSSKKGFGLWSILHYATIIISQRIQGEMLRHLSNPRDWTFCIWIMFSTMDSPECRLRCIDQVRCLTSYTILFKNKEMTTTGKRKAFICLRRNVTIFPKWFTCMGSALRCFTLYLYL